MIKRRNFLLYSTLLGISFSQHSKALSRFEKSFKEVESTLLAVQNHLFPKGSNFPSAQEMKSIEFLLHTMSHKSYDKDIRIFVIEGAEELFSRTKGRFIKMSDAQKERALRKYEETDYGSNWLSRIMTLTLEGMLSDSLYGSNIHESSWKILHSYGGYPRPKARYLDDV